MSTATRLKTDTRRKRTKPDTREAYRLGAEAFARGAKYVPVHDARFMKFLREHEGDGLTLEYLESWGRGWTRANMDAPC